VGKIEPQEAARSGQDEAYRQSASEYGTALDRLAYAYEADPDRRRDLLQEIHLALWRSLEKFNGQCSLRTWIYRVAHNVATSHVILAVPLDLRLAQKYQRRIEILDASQQGL